MAREAWLRRVGAFAIFFAAAATFCGQRGARAADSDAASEGSNCPDADAVWANVVKLVPSAAPLLLAARPRVTIVDLGDRYRVSVTAERGLLERVYQDAARECDKRTRFAAEFIVLALLPPVITDPTAGPGTPPIAIETTPPAPSPESTAPTAPPPAPIPAPAPPPSAPGPVASDGAGAASAPRGSVGVAPAIVRIELSAMGQASAPVLGALGLLSWGGELRLRVGRGTWAAVAAIGYLPQIDFTQNDLRLGMTRVPIMVGMRAQKSLRYVNLGGDLAAAVDAERYEGLSPHSPETTWRVTPGVEANVIVSSHALVGFAPFVTLKCALFPFVQSLAIAPEGDQAKTPSLWIGAGLGALFEL